MPANRREDSLAHAPFSYRHVKGERVMLFYEGRHIETLTGRSAMRFLERIAQATPQQAQLLMAKATKNFKRGNERDAENRR